MKALAKLLTKDRDRLCNLCNAWGGNIVAKLRPCYLLELGCGADSILLRYLKRKPKRWAAIDANPGAVGAARQHGISCVTWDLNDELPYHDRSFDVVYASQTIEHIHNTRFLVSEIYRVLKPGGHAVFTSENLTSLLNTLAMMMGVAPFSMTQVCGWYLGNRFSPHHGEDIYVGDIGDRSFPGVSGHVRVLSFGQARELFERVGFKVEVQSMGLLPFPGILGRCLERLLPRRGHFLMIHATKP